MNKKDHIQLLNKYETHKVAINIHKLITSPLSTLFYEMIYIYGVDPHTRTGSDMSLCLSTSANDELNSQHDYWQLGLYVGPSPTVPGAI